MCVSCVSLKKKLKESSLRWGHYDASPFSVLQHTMSFSVYVRVCFLPSHYLGLVIRSALSVDCSKWLSEFLLGGILEAPDFVECTSETHDTYSIAIPYRLKWLKEHQSLLLYRQYVPRV